MKKKFVANVTATFVSYKLFLLLSVGALGRFSIGSLQASLCSSKFRAGAQFAIGENGLVALTNARLLVVN